MFNLPTGSRLKTCIYTGQRCPLASCATCRTSSTTCLWTGIDCLRRDARISSGTVGRATTATRIPRWRLTTDPQIRCQSDRATLSISLTRTTTTTTWFSSTPRITVDSDCEIRPMVKTYTYLPIIINYSILQWWCQFNFNYCLYKMTQNKQFYLLYNIQWCKLYNSNYIIHLYCRTGILYVRIIRIV